MTTQLDLFAAPEVDETQAKIEELRDRGAVFVINHSGGKDSQAMRIVVERTVPRDQLLVVHADLPGADWAGTFEHVLYDSQGLEVIKASSVKTFEQMALHRGRWPSPGCRQCTSDLKRGPIEREIRRWLKRNDHCGIVVSCMGMRAEESSGRAKLKTLTRHERNSVASREWYDWLPVHGLTESKVFETIASDGKQTHWAYSEGMTRLSCVFCIMASKADLTTAARLSPETFARYVATEKVLDQTFVMPSKSRGRRWLEEVTGVEADPDLVASHVDRIGKRVAAAK